MQRKTLVIIGAGGRLGGALVRRYSKTHNVIAMRRADLDLLQLDRIRPALADLDFDVVIYTAGVTGVDYCEDHEDEAFLSNSDAPKIIAEICLEKGARFIHFSTDYVFDGENPIALKETDEAQPVSVYGHSKRAGEKAVLDVSPDFLVIRVSWVFGPDRPSFPDMILQRALEQDRVEAIADKVSCPAYTEDLAEWIEPMLDDKRYSGLLHLSNSGATTWQDYGQKILDIAAKLGLPIKARIVHPILRKDLTAFKAIRPQFTAFDLSKYKELSGQTPRPWEEAMEDYIKLKYVS